MYQIVEFGFHLFNETRPSGHISRPTNLLRLNYITRGSPTNNHIMAVNINRFDPQNVMQVIEFLYHLSTHCGLVTPYDNIDLGQHWFR